MNHIAVSSTNLVSVGYDPTIQTLEICFHSGACYQYFSVPQHVYDGLMGARSHGTYFDTTIKKGGYRYRRIR